MPANRKSAEEATTARPAWRFATSPSFAKTSASAAVANTSKKPSTQRCTTHQRQYSITDRCVRAENAKPGAVHEADRGRGAGEHQHQRAAVVAAPQRRPEAAQHEPEPQHEPGEQTDLPGAAEVDVLVALVPEPERQPERQLLVDREVLARQRSRDDQQQRAEQHVDSQPLEARLAPADHGGQEQAGREERGRDPEDGRLDVPGAGQAVGQVLREREAEEGLALDRVVRGDARRAPPAPRRARPRSPGTWPSPSSTA